MTDTTIDKKTRRKVIAAGVSGNVLEWYDFAVYGFYAPIIGKLFFPSDDPTVSLIASFGAFAAGFLMRPIGGFIFGHIGDRIGRKATLVLSVLLMAIPTGLIGILPDHATIGAAAAFLMVGMRMLQGLSVGGEYTGSVVFLAEHAPIKKRGLFCSWTQVGATGGVLLGSGISALISHLLTDAQVADWGWRLPFLFGILVGIVGLLIRRGLPDLPVEPQTDNASWPVIEAVKTEWRAMGKMIGYTIINAVGFYIVFVYVLTWLIQDVKEPRSSALDINTISMAVLFFSIPLMGWLSDRIGRKTILAVGAGGFVALSYPLILLMHHPNFTFILLGQVGFALLIACLVGAGPANLAEMFPRKVRVSAMSVGYNISMAIFGGTTPLIAAWLLSRTHNDLSFVWYMIACAAVSLVFTLMLREGAGKPLPA